MFNFSPKGALICAMLPIGLLASGCSGMGQAGFHNVVAGNWPAAKEDFTEDYTNHPEHPIAIFNMGATYHHDGDLDKADTMFSEAVERGKGYMPDKSLEPKDAGPTVADYACARLHRDNRLDPNCGDRIAIETPPAPPPAPVAEATPEPAPAVEAEATTVPPKQDRN
jgi:tetratricopeptide (TPR) repeat protein